MVRNINVCVGGSKTRYFYAYLMMLGVNRPIQIAQQRILTAALHIYRPPPRMAAPIQSYCDDTMHVDGVVFFNIISDAQYTT